MNPSFPFPHAKTHLLSGVLTLFFIFLSLQVYAVVRYVKPTASGTGNGSSWANASANLQAMINASGSGDEVWVAAGTYKPTSGTDRSISFSMKNGVAIYGGFNGTETQLSQRNWRTNVTTLSGDIGISGNNSDNSYSVIANEGINSAIFDGFTVTQANSTPPTGDLLGGGIYNAGSSPIIRNCIFSNNTGSYANAGIFNFNDGTPTIINCLFINNVGTVYSSGVINFGGSANIINCTFYGNHTAILNQGGNALSVRNCILWGNNNSFNLLVPHPATLTVANSIVQGGWSGTGNLSTDPLFVNAAGGDFRLQACSPAINAGGNGYVPGGITTDLDGNARFYNNGTVDIGAYEFQSTPPTFVTCYRDSDNDSFGNLAMSQVFCNTCGTGYVPNGADCNDSNQAINPFAAEICDGADNNCNTQTDEGNVCCPSGNVIYVKANATGANNGASWTNAYTNLQSALNNNCAGITEIWVAAGTYKPTTGTDRNISFVMKNGVAIYGGFNGTETQLSQRNWRTNVTTLSGDIGAAGNADNTYRVINNNFIANAPLGSSAILDGFTVEAGNANGSFPLNLGGGMWNAYASPTVRNCIFRNNTATSGAAIFNDNSQANVTNCLFTGNSCSVAGSAISNGGGTASAQVVNCTFFGNTGGSSTISNEVNATAISNCIIWGNANGVSGGTVSYSIVQGGFSGTGNLNANPLFVNAAGGDFRLQACSPAMDAGTNTNAPSTDFEGNVRPFNATGVSNADMGAYEYQSTVNVCTACELLIEGRIYVNASASGSNDGRSWANAFTDLQLALALARSKPTCVTQIWVAAGTYKPTTGTDRNASFSMINGVAIYGGFNGTETQLSQRNWAANVTILSGDIGVIGYPSDNCYHVIFNDENGLNSTALLDGFTIRGGDANSFSPNDRGGGMCNLASSPAVANCIFTGNWAVSGGGMHNEDSSSPVVTNCHFFGNSAGSMGGGIHNRFGSQPNFINCTISGNIPSEVFYFAGFPSFTNCIIWGNHNLTGSNAVVTYSIIQGGHPGTGNLNTDPFFVNAAGGDFRLQACSPAINVGSNAAVPGGITTDLDGNPRFFNNGVVDRGAYEFQGTPVAMVTCYQDSDNDNFGNPAVSQVFCNACATGYVANNTDCNDANDAINPLASEVCDGADNNCNTQTDEGNVCCPSGNILYVKANATGANNGASWTDAYTDLQSALNRNCPNITEIWVAAGTYKPTTGSDRNISFVMKNGVAIYGGFNGTETLLSQRNWRTNVTTLSGDIGTAGNADNSYSVVYAGSGVNNTAIIDGFTVTGAAGGTYAGGIYVVNGSPTISHCLLIGNSSTVFGGGLACYNGSPIVTSCTFSGNTSNAGGGMANGFGGMPIVTNCLFINNTAIYFAGGGGLFSQNASMTLTNCTFSGNSPESIHCNVAINISNCVIWGNSLNFYNANASISNCIVEGGYAQCLDCPNGNGNANPLFVNAAGGDFNLQACSPAVNTGSNAVVPGGVTTDLDGNPRTFGGTVDMGAYEFQAAPTPIVPVCQNQTVLLNDMGMATFSAALLNNGSTGCGTLLYTVGGQSTLNFTCSDTGNPIPVTLTVADNRGITATCSAMITVVDNTAPTITCPATQTLVLGANCTATLPNYTSLATTGDNCGVQSVTQSPTAGTTVSGAGNMTVTLTVTDVNGNETECTFTVTKVDNTAPTITCPTTQTLVLGANCTATLPNYTSLATTGDNCGVQSVTQSPTAGTSVSGAGNMTVTLTVTDVNGNNTECTFTVTKVDQTPPTISCPTTQTLVLGANCTATLPNYTSLATTGDNCGVQSVTQSPTAGTTVSGAGNMTVTLTVTDVNGLTNSCTFTVTKVDNTPPTITCPTTQTLVLGANCTATLPNYTSLATTGDNCGVQSVTQSPTAGTSVSGAGNMTVTLTVTDVNGLTNSCTFTVTKVDNTPPTISCPTTQTLVLGANCTATLPNYTSLATTGDNCGVQSVTQSPIAGTLVSGAGNMTVTLTVTDVNGLTNSCTFTVTKVDNTPPTISCPTTQTLVLGANCTATLPNYTSLATTGDNCGVQSVTQSPTAGTSVSGAGNMTVTLTVTDVNGLTNSCTFTVTKVDNTPPTITCPTTQTLVLGANCTATLPNYTSLATTGDNCGVQSVTQSPPAGTSVSGAGNMTVTLTVTDVNGLTNSCTFTVTKVDQTPPTVVCKNTTVFIGNTGTYTLQAADVFNATASSDNCSGMLTVTNISPAMVSCAQLNQIIPVTVTVQDASGNTATCTAQITVQEGSALPLGWSSDNVGNANGAAGYKACSLNGSFTVSANGFSTSSSDVLHFTSQQLCGNGEITVRVMAVSGGGWAGVMMRESGSPGAKKVALKTQLTNMIRREIRTVQNGPANILNFNRPQHVWLRLVRDGSTFTGYTSLNGTTWSFAFSATVSMAGCIQFGVFSESINANTTTTATFSNIVVTGASNNSLANVLPDVQIAAEQDEQVRVFPNPTIGEVTIDLDIHAGKPGTIQVFNALGALTIQERLVAGNPETHRLNLGGPAGVYTVVIQLDDRRIVRRVVVDPNGGK